MRRAGVLLALCICAGAVGLAPGDLLGQEAPEVLVAAEEGIVVDGERAAVFLAGGPWQKHRDKAQAPGRSTATPSLPSWWDGWRNQLQAGLQPRAAPSVRHHPLLKGQVLLLDVGLDAPRTLPAVELACPEPAVPQARPPRAMVQAWLMEAGDRGEHVIALQTGCLAAEQTRLEQLTRLVVRTDPAGKVLEAWGIRLPSLPVPPAPRADGLPDWPIEPDPATLHARLPKAGRLVQARLLPAATWGSALPDLPSLDPRAPVARPVVRKLAWWLDDQGRPKAGLLPAREAGRDLQPLERTGLEDLALQGVDGLVLLQGLEPTKEREAGTGPVAYLALHLRPDGTVWRQALPLPRGPADGSWACEALPDRPALRCQFQPGVVIDALARQPRTLRWVTGQGFVTEGR